MMIIMMRMTKIMIMIMPHLLLHWGKTKQMNSSGFFNSWIIFNQIWHKFFSNFGTSTITKTFFKSKYEMLLQKIIITPSQDCHTILVPGHLRFLCLKIIQSKHKGAHDDVIMVKITCKPRYDEELPAPVSLLVPYKPILYMIIMIWWHHVMV